MTLLAMNTDRLKMGHCVTNPGTREPTVTASSYATLHDISNGRMVMGIGRGDSARRVIGYKPVKMAEFEAALAMMKELMNGRPVEWNGKELELTWAQGRPDIPLYVAAYGPRALGVAGRVGDGVIIQLADPVIIQWIMDQARAAAVGGRARPGRAPVPRLRTEHHHGRHAGGPRGRALVPGDGLEPRHGPDRAVRGELGDPQGPDRLRQGAEVLRLQGPQPRGRRPRRIRHGRDLRPLLGDRERRAGDRKLKELESIGVDHYNIYLMTHGQEDILRAYGSEIIPQFKGAAV